MELPKPVAWLLTRSGLDVLPSRTQFEPREFETFKIQKQEPLFTAEQVLALMVEEHEWVERNDVDFGEAGPNPVEVFRAAYCRMVEG